jgi:hypothetical protein
VVVRRGIEAGEGEERRPKEDKAEAEAVAREEGGGQRKEEAWGRTVDL